MNLSLKQFTEGVRAYRKAELTALKRENAALRGQKLLAELAMGAFPTYAPPANNPAPVMIYERVKTVDAVRAVLNGHGMDMAELRSAVRSQFPNTAFSRRAIKSRVGHLVDQGEATHIGEPGNYRYLKAVASVLVGIVLCGCRSTPPLLMDSGKSAVIVTVPPHPPSLAMPLAQDPALWAELRAPLPPIAILSWPALPTAKAYRVDYGLALNSMTNSVITSTTNCHILGSFIGQRHFYRVREMNSKAYGKQVSSGMVETK